MENNLEQQNKTIKEGLLEKIIKEEIKMRPKSFFVMKVVILGVVGSMILFTSVLILNFISFSIRLNGHDSLLGFGSRGFSLFLQLFPWMLLSIDILLIIFLEWLIRQFRFGTKIPILYLLGGIVIVTVSSGLLIDRATTLNDYFLDQADHAHLPMPINIYFQGARRLPPPGDHICKCKILAINNNMLVAQDLNLPTQKHLTIVVPPEYAHFINSLSVGDIVFIAGDRHEDTFESFGISKFSFQPQ